MRIAPLAACLLLAGCAYNVTLMPRDSGKTYTGTLDAGAGRGTMTLAMDGATCTGPIVRVASNETFGIASGFGATNRGTTASGFSVAATSGDVFAKALLTCSDGSGLRCDMTGRPGTAGGVCQDDKGRIFDAIATRR